MAHSKRRALWSQLLNFGACKVDYAEVCARASLHGEEAQEGLRNVEEII